MFVSQRSLRSLCAAELRACVLIFSCRLCANRAEAGAEICNVHIIRGKKGNMPLDVNSTKFLDLQWFWVDEAGATKGPVTTR